jgi:hypothetical protein
MIKEHCYNCGCEIHPFLTGRKCIDDKVHCEDCYVDKLGEIIEQHPIGMPLWMHKNIGKEL